MRINQRLRRLRRDRNAGVEINYGQLWAAYLIEGGIILATAVAGYEFAERYVSDNWELWTMAIVGTAAVAIAEVARIQLAKATRTQAGFFMKLLATAGVLCMCMVTTKSMSQVMDQVFSPRLRQVQTATDNVLIAEAALATLQTHRGASNEAVKPLQQGVDDANRRIDAANKRMDDANRRIAEINSNIQAQGKAPAPKAVQKVIKSTCWNKRRTKKWSCNKTITVIVDQPWAGQQFADQLAAANAERDAANAAQTSAIDARDAAVAARDKAAGDVAAEVEDIARQEHRIAETRNLQREAVANSQLHSFTAMIFAKDPVEVTDGEIHRFLRFFVFLPAIMISLASTLLAITAYRRVPLRKPRQGPLEIDRTKTLERHIESIVNASLSRRQAADAKAVIIHPSFKKEA